MTKLAHEHSLEPPVLPPHVLEGKRHHHRQQLYLPTVKQVGVADNDSEFIARYPGLA